MQMKKEERDEKLAVIKSSIELLEECKQKIIDNEKLSDKDKKKRIEEIDAAIAENYSSARKGLLQASTEEIKNASYGVVSEEYKSKYENRLKKKGLTDEQLHQKEQAVAMISAEVEETPKKRHRRTKRTEQRDDEKGFDPNNIVRLENEEELMKKTLIKDNNDLERRRHRSSDTMSDTPRNPRPLDAIGTVMESKKIKPREEVAASVTVNGDKEAKPKESKRVMSGYDESKCEYKFDVREFSDYPKHDVIALPSHGECYPHKKGRVPVSYLTAADENIIASPNMYRDGKVIDTILERKILDKDIKVNELIQGDRDAIVLFLRRTAYGNDFPIIAKHPETGKEYPVNVNLATLQPYPFNLTGDENGYFEYRTNNGNKGCDIIKFKYLNVKEENDIRDEIIAMTTDLEKFNAVKYIYNLKKCLGGMLLSDDDIKELDDCLEDMKDILRPDDIKLNTENAYLYSITNQMIKYTVSVNGNEDRDFVKNYIENMTAKEAFNYRAYVNDNTPSMNMKINVQVPKSDGGGSFATFLRLDDYVFGNI